MVFSKYYRFLVKMVLLISLISCDSIEHGREVAAAVDIKLLEGALIRYSAENGPLPKAGLSPTETNIAIMNALFHPNKASSQPKSAPYLIVSAEHLSATNAFLDPWGMPYLIRLSFNDTNRVELGGHVVEGKWAIWSSGKNLINDWGTGDDLCSWK